MALRKKRLGTVKSPSNTNQNVVGDKYQKRFGRKRVLISSGKIQDPGDICKKTVDRTQNLEALPREILVRIICKVEHGDLKQLFNVSKTIREATLIAKKWHFEYSTPRKTLFFRDGLDSVFGLGDDIEVPLMKRHRFSRTTCANKASKISVALFK